MNRNLASGGTRLPIVSIGELFRLHGEMPPAVINGLVRRGEVMNIIGAPKVGKSWLAMDLALAVATGRRWLDTYDTERGKVLYVDNELKKSSLKQRFQQVFNTRGLWTPQNSDLSGWLEFCPVRGQALDLSEFLSKLLTTSPRGKYSLVVIDALYRCLPEGVSENDNTSMARLYSQLDKAAETLDCAFVLIHHTTKGAQGGKSVTDVGAGAGSISRAADTHLVLRQHAREGAVVLDAVARSWKPVEPLCVAWEGSVLKPAPELNPNDVIRFDYQKPRKPKEPKPKAETPKVSWTVEKFVDEVIGDRTLGTAEISLIRHEHNLSQRIADSLRKLAVSQGLLVEIEKHDDNGNRLRGAPKQFRRAPSAEAAEGGKT